MGEEKKEEEDKKAAAEAAAAKLKAEKEKKKGVLGWIQDNKKLAGGIAAGTLAAGAIGYKMMGSKSSGSVLSSNSCSMSNPMACISQASENPVAVAGGVAALGAAFLTLTKTGRNMAHSAWKAIRCKSSGKDSGEKSNSNTTSEKEDSVDNAKLNENKTDNNKKTKKASDKFIEDKQGDLNCEDWDDKDWKTFVKANWSTKRKKNELDKTMKKLVEKVNEH